MVRPEDKRNIYSLTCRLIYCTEFSSWRVSNLRRWNRWAKRLLELGRNVRGAIRSDVDAPRFVVNTTTFLDKLDYSRVQLYSWAVYAVLRATGIDWGRVSSESEMLWMLNSIASSYAGLLLPRTKSFLSQPRQILQSHRGDGTWYAWLFSLMLFQMVSNINLWIIQDPCPDTKCYCWTNHQLIISIRCYGK